MILKMKSHYEVKKSQIIQLFYKICFNFCFRGINIKVPIPASAMGKVTVLPAKKGIFYITFAVHSAPISNSASCSLENVFGKENIDIRSNLVLFNMFIHSKY